MTDAYEEVESPRYRRRLEAVVGRVGRQPAPGGRLVALQSGLPLHLLDGRPVEPKWSGATLLQLRLKRGLVDIPLSLLALVGLGPLLLVVICLVRLTSRGPAIFRQTRVGLGGREFEILKFRTMRFELCDEAGLSQATANDERVTRIGRFLRNTSIDELPQLWNILRGDMAVIGPRPMVLGQRAAGADYREVVPYYDYRHLVRPGLSGWAQANGLRGSTEDLAAARQRIDHDCAYVQNVSLLLDLRIILKTIATEFLVGSGR